jgi:hypothetical protein
MLWAFSIWLESVAILPQLFMLQRTGEAETITTHYLFALGAYRGLYIPNWIWRYFTEVHYHWDPIPVVAGIIQTVLYTDFFYIYYTKYEPPSFGDFLARHRLMRQQGAPRQEVQPSSIAGALIYCIFEALSHYVLLYCFVIDRGTGPVCRLSCRNQWVTRLDCLMFSIMTWRREDRDLIQIKN